MLILFVSCSKDVELMKRTSICKTICKDGTISSSSGSGACSWHGGVSSGCGTDVINRMKNY